MIHELLGRTQRWFLSHSGGKKKKIGLEWAYLVSVLINTNKNKTSSSIKVELFPINIIVSQNEVQVC